MMPPAHDRHLTCCSCCSAGCSIGCSAGCSGCCTGSSAGSSVPGTTKGALFSLTTCRGQVQQARGGGETRGWQAKTAGYCPAALCALPPLAACRAAANGTWMGSTASQRAAAAARQERRRPPASPAATLPAPSRAGLSTAPRPAACAGAGRPAGGPRPPPRPAVPAAPAGCPPGAPERRGTPHPQARSPPPSLPPPCLLALHPHPQLCHVEACQRLLAPQRPLAATTGPPG